MAAVRGGELLGSVRLPIAGIVSDRSVPEVAEELSGFRRALAALGVLTLPVSPELKLTDLGLVDVTRGVIVPLIVEA